MLRQAEDALALAAADTGAVEHDHHVAGPCKRGRFRKIILDGAVISVREHDQALRLAGPGGKLYAAQQIAFIGKAGEIFCFQVRVFRHKILTEAGRRFLAYAEISPVDDIGYYERRRRRNYDSSAQKQVFLFCHKITIVYIIIQFYFSMGVYGFKYPFRPFCSIARQKILRRIINNVKIIEINRQNVCSYTGKW